MKLDYVLLDVFTTERLAGNPLAVVTRADGLAEGRMQAIANEFNLSETVFISRPKAERHTAAVRIFTPRFELPFAGHPTVGAAVVLGMQTRATAIRIEEKIGLVTCVIESVSKRGGQARFALPVLPAEVGRPPEVRHIASALGLEVEDIGCRPHGPSVYSAGVVYYLVPVRSAAVLRRIAVDQRGWAEVFPHGMHGVYAYTETPEEPEHDYAARMLTPNLGEDPATGSAAAALIGQLAGHLPDGQYDLMLRQGYEMGRPSTIAIQLRIADGALTHGGIGGHAVVVGEGTLELGE